MYRPVADGRSSPVPTLSSMVAGRIVGALDQDSPPGAQATHGNGATPPMSTPSAGSGGR